MFSIIIPVYNGEKTILSTLNSILLQSFLNYEVIVVNDGSTDGTLDVLNSIKDSRIRILNQENSRQGAARNLGVYHAKGDYIIFVDADDSISDNLLNAIYHESKKKDNLDIIFYDILRCYNSSTKKRVPFDLEILHKVNNNIDGKIIGHATPCNAAYSKSFIKTNNINFLTGVYFEDISFMVDTLLKARNVAYVPDVFYQYNIIENSTVRSINININLDVIDNFQYLLNNQLLCSSYREEMQFLAMKYILFDAVVRTLNPNINSSLSNKIANDLVCYYKENFGEIIHNKYLKKESFVFKLIIKLSFNKKFKMIRIINKLRGIIK